jgi:large subunit ribosomal protein L17
MRHGKKLNHLGRTASHRKAMLSNMASSLILHKRISTTLAKAKALRVYVEPLITKSKSDTTHNRRVVFSYLQDKDTVRVLFDEVSEKVTDRPGGYTRIIKTGNRLGDNAEMCIMELVDYNELLLAEKEPQKARTRRSRRGGKKEETQVSSKPEKTPEVTTAPVAEVEAEEVPVAEEVQELSDVAEEVIAETEVQEENQEDSQKEETDEESKKE